jgi:hypothetical protein
MSLLSYMRDTLPFCSQINPKLKQAPVEINLNDNEVIGEDNLDILDKYSNQKYPIMSILDVIQENYHIDKDKARKRLRNLFIVLEGMEYDFGQLIRDAQRAGKLRQLFEMTVASEIAKHYRHFPNIFDECDELTNSECLAKPINPIKPIKLDYAKPVKPEVWPALTTSKKCQETLEFFLLYPHIFEETKDAKAVKKQLQKIIAEKSATTGLEIKNMEAALKNLQEELECDPSGKFENLSLHIGANQYAVGYMLRANSEEGGVGKKVIQMGTRLLNSSERMDIRPKKVATALIFALDKCKDVIRRSPVLTIFTEDPDVMTYFDVSYQESAGYMSNLESIAKHEWVLQNENEADAVGLLLLLRSDTISKTRHATNFDGDKFGYLYALKDTVTAVLSVTVTKRRRNQLAERKALRAKKLGISLDDENTPMPSIVATEELTEILTSVAKAWSTSNHQYAPLIQLWTKRLKAENPTEIGTVNCQVNELLTALDKSKIKYLDLANLCKKTDEPLSAIEKLCSEKKLALPQYMMPENFYGLIADHFSSIQRAENLAESLEKSNIGSTTPNSVITIDLE